MYVMPCMLSASRSSCSGSSCSSAAHIFSTSARTSSSLLMSQLDTVAHDMLLAYSFQSARTLLLLLLLLEQAPFALNTKQKFSIN
jgi:hypothetical protein